MRRRAVLVCLTATGALLAGLLAVVLWAAPRGDVPDPPAAASPARVVRSYVAAVNARDFATANRIRPTARIGRFARVTTMADLEVLAVSSGRGDTAHAPYRHAVRVLTASTWSGGDITMPDGRHQWSFLLGRDRADQPWRIYDWGMG